MGYKKINKLFPGDLVSFPGKIDEFNPIVLILSSSDFQKTNTQEVTFIILGGDEMPYEGISNNEGYYLISRIK